MDPRFPALRPPPRPSTATTAPALDRASQELSDALRGLQPWPAAGPEAGVQALTQALASAPGQALTLDICRRVESVIGALEEDDLPVAGPSSEAIAMLSHQLGQLQWRFLEAFRALPEGLAVRRPLLPLLAFLARRGENDLLSREAQTMHRELRSTFREMHKVKAVVTTAAGLRIQAVGPELGADGAGWDYLVTSQVSRGSFGKFCLVAGRNGELLAGKKARTEAKLTLPTKPRTAKKRKDYVVDELTMLDAAGSPLAALDQFRVGSDLYIVMPLQAGTLSEMNKVLTPAERRLVGRLAAGQLNEQLHKLRLDSIIHGDIKPNNCLVGPDGRFHLADFGLAQFSDDFDEVEAGRGTHAFMAPEALRAVVAREAGGPRRRINADGLDSWAFAVTLAAFADPEGIPPFGRGTARNILAAQELFLAGGWPREAATGRPGGPFAGSRTADPELIDALCARLLSRPTPPYPTAALRFDLAALQPADSEAQRTAEARVMRFVRNPAHLAAMNALRATWAAQQAGATWALAGPRGELGLGGRADVDPERTLTLSPPASASDPERTLTLSGGSGRST